MNYRLLLEFTFSIASLLLLVAELAFGAEHVGATEAIASTLSCNLPNAEPEAMQDLPEGNTLVAAVTPSSVTLSSAEFSEYPSMDFSAAESDAAVALFGCDCPSCIGALQLLRSQSLLDSYGGQGSGQGHCWTALKQRSSLQKVQEVLEGLEAEEVDRR